MDVNRYSSLDVERYILRPPICVFHDAKIQHNSNPTNAEIRDMRGAQIIEPRAVDVSGDQLHVPFWQILVGFRIGAELV